jgi:hypothetical protein
MKWLGDPGRDKSRLSVGHPKKSLNNNNDIITIFTKMGRPDNYFYYWKTFTRENLN